MIRYLLLTVVGTFCAFALPVPLFAQQISEEYALALGHYRRHDWTRAADSLAAISANTSLDHATRSNALFFLGESQIQLGKYEEATRTFDRLTTTYPSHQYLSRAMFRKAEAAFFDGKSERAISVFSQFIQKFDADPLVEYALPYLGELYLNDGEHGKSQDAYQKALKRFPNSSLASKCRFGLAKSYRQSGDPNNAARFYQFVADQSDSLESQEARLQLGTLWFETGQFEKCKSELEKISTEKSDFLIQTQAIYWIARSEMELENWDIAKSKLRSIASPKIEDPLGSAIYFDGAVSAIKDNDNSTALELLSELTNHFSESPWADDALDLSVSINADQKNWDSVKNLSNKFQTSFPESPMMERVLAHRGRAHYETGQSTQALQIFERLLEQNGVKDAHSVAYWIYWKSVCEIELKRFPDAEKTLAKADEIDIPESLLPYVLLAKATVLQANKNWPAAAKALAEYIQLQPNQPETWQCQIELSVVCARLKKWDDAMRHWTSWTKTNPEQVKQNDAAELLGELAYQDGQLELARNWFSVLTQPNNSKDTIARGHTQLAWLDATEKKSISSDQIQWNKLQNDDSTLDALLLNAENNRKGGKTAEAESIYRQMIERFEPSAKVSIAKFQLATLLGSKKEQSARAESIELLTSICSDKNATDIADRAWYELAWAYRRDNNSQSENDAYHQIVDNFPESKFWADAAYRLAKWQFEQKDFETANASINTILQGKSDSQIREQAYLLRFDIEITQRKFELAEKTVAVIQNEFADSESVAKVHFAFAEALFINDQVDKSQATFEHFMALSGKSEAEQLVAKLRIAQCLGYKDQWAKAAEMATSMLQQHPEFDRAYELHLIVGRYQASLAKFDEAREAYASVVNSPQGKRTSSAAMAQWLIGESFFHQQNYVDAIEAYYRVDSLYSYPQWQAAALLQAAKCHEKLDQWEHAARLYQQIVNEHPDTEYAKRATSRLEAKRRRSTQSPQKIR